jgi:hypothetical protein
MEFFTDIFTPHENTQTVVVQWSFFRYQNYTVSDASLITVVELLGKIKGLSPAARGIKGKTEGAMRRVRRGKLLQDDSKEHVRCRNLEEEEVDFTVYRTRFGEGCGKLPNTDYAKNGLSIPSICTSRCRE